MKKHTQDWDPKEPEALADHLATCDQMRSLCPVAHSDSLGWSLFRHEDVFRVLRDHESYSNAVSSHVSIPNGMDPPLHTPYRRLVETYFTPERMADFEPTCREIASHRVAQLAERSEVELMADLAHPFALDVQCAFVGWPRDLQGSLSQWLSGQQEATLRQDRARLRDLAARLESLVAQQIEARRAPGMDDGNDATSRLMREELDGRRLSNSEIGSILRNWTVGELGTMASSLGILVQYLVEDQGLQEQLRQDPGDLSYAIEEILRMRGPLLTNRRVCLKTTNLGGRRIEAGDRISLMWASVNRDETVFQDATSFRHERDQGDNLLWGAGIHVCPGAPLARLQLRIALETLLQATHRWTAGAAQPVPAVFPAAGWRALPISLELA